MISIVTWLWGTKYSSKHVNILRAMTARNLRLEHKFICFTDHAPNEFRDDIAVLPLPTVGHRANDPMALKRLWMFSEEAAAVLGPRFVNIDLDTVIVGDITPLLSRHEDFVVWKAPFYDPKHHKVNGPPYCYNMSLVMMNAGARHFVWERFANDPEQELENAASSGWVYHGDSDIISNILIPNEKATWGTKDGVYAYWTHLDFGTKPLPGNARMISFYGKADPSQREVKHRCRWVGQHWHE